MQTPSATLASVSETLTPRQIEVLTLLAQGNSSKEIATKLGSATKTVDVHRQQIMQRLGIRTLAGLVLYALKHKLISLEEQ